MIELIKDADVVSFASNYNPETGNLLDQLFPNEKTRNINISYLQTRKNTNAPIALVHAWDSEAKIGSREKFSEKEVQKFLIKKKLQLNEEYAEMAEKYKDNAEIQDLIFNDLGSTSDAVRNRALVMKGELLANGKFTVKENNLSFTMDFGVPADNKVAVDWSDPNADILGDINTMINKAKDAGYELTRGVTSNKVLAKIQMNVGLRKAMFGVNSDRIPTIAEVNAYLNDNYGFVLVSFDAVYRYERANGTIATKRYFDENKLSLFGGARTETLGKGFYGVTPEERNEKLDVRTSKNIYIMNTVWATPDPVATWTKASAVFVPVLADPDNLFIATVTL